MPTGQSPGGVGPKKANPGLHESQEGAATLPTGYILPHCCRTNPQSFCILTGLRGPGTFAFVETAGGTQVRPNIIENGLN